MTTEPTLEEKAALLAGRNLWSTQAHEPSELPSLVLTDGPHGVRKQPSDNVHDAMAASLPATCFPPAVALAASWDPHLVGRMAEALGREAQALGVNVLLGPGVNIKRSPLCGRNFEYFSEDPFLSGALGAAHVEGVQRNGVGACVKHFAANNQETDRMRVSADVDERTLREVYLPAFENIVRSAQPATVMAAYNKINGTYASQNAWLLTEVLREQWGFEGLVVSDWGAVPDPVAAVAAGLDLKMPGDARGTSALVDAVRAGEVEEACLDRAVAALRTLAAKTALPSPGADIDFDAHHRLAREVAADCLVLLKNERETLPLTHTRSVAVIGTFATQPRYQGGGSSHVNAVKVDSGLDELRAAMPGAELSYATGEDLRETEAAARNAEVAVVFAGLAESDESEGFDRQHIDLPAEQVALIRAVASIAPHTVVVLLNGGVVSLEGWHDEVDAIIEAWLPGQAGGGAIADVLTGRVNPSGRLAETIPVRLEDNPSFLNFPGEAGHVRYGEGVFVGYRYYESANVPVRYPFGHGLSYTTFAYDNVRATVTASDHVVLRLRVTNTGTRVGKHVVQVYVGAPERPVRSALRELRAFTKVALEPGESTEVELELDRRAFAYYDIARRDWSVAAGVYSVQLGHSAHEIAAEVEVELHGDAVIRRLTMDSSVEEWLTHPIGASALLEAMAAGLPEEGRRKMKEGFENSLHMVNSMPFSQFLGFLPTPPEPAVLEAIMTRTETP